MTRLLKISIIAIGCISLSACFVTSAGMHKKQGYADISFPHFRHTDNTFNLSLGPLILKPIRQLVMKEHQEYADLVDGIEAIRIRVFDAETGKKSLNYAIDKSIEDISEDGWQTIVSVKEEHERVAIQMSADQNVIYGISIVAINEKEAVFVNLIGEFKFDKFDQWAKKMQETQRRQRQIIDASETTAIPTSKSNLNGIFQALSYVNKSENEAF